MSVIVSCKTHLSKHDLSTLFWLFYNMCLLQDNLINYCINCPYFAQFGCTLYKMKRIYLSLCEGSSIVLWRLVWWYQSFEANLPVWKYKWQVCCVCVGGGTWSWAVEPILDSCFVITPVGSKQTIFKNWLQLRVSAHFSISVHLKSFTSSAVGCRLCVWRPLMWLNTVKLNALKMFANQQSF